MCYLIYKEPHLSIPLQIWLWCILTLALGRADRSSCWRVWELGSWQQLGGKAVEIIDFTQHSPLAIYYTPITCHSFWENRVRVFQTHVAIKCQAHAQLFVAEKAARSAGGTVTGVHAFIIFLCRTATNAFDFLSLSLSITIWKNLATVFSWLSAAFGFVWWSCLCRWQVGAMEAQLIRLYFRCGCVGVTTFKEGNVWPFPRPRSRVFLDWSKGFVMQLSEVPRRSLRQENQRQAAEKTKKQWQSCTAFRLKFCFACKLTCKRYARKKCNWPDAVKKH